MENTWLYQGEEPIKIKKYLQSLGMGHRLFNDIKRGSGTFEVDHRPVRPTTKILPNQPLTIKVQPEAEDPSVAVSHKPLAVVYEDDNWLVMNKQAGVPSIPGPTTDDNTILNRVKGHLVAEDSPERRPHLVTRLDYNTSGLLLVAKHHVAQSMISQQVEHHQLHKEYLVIVSGMINSDKGTINSPLARVPGQARRVVDPDGDPALTEYEVLKRGNGWTLVRAILKTGRTHQIRVHFSSIGHPLLGDQLYGGDTALIDRQALHAVKFGFHDPFTGERRNFEAELPADMKKLIN